MESLFLSLSLFKFSFFLSFKIIHTHPFSLAPSPFSYTFQCIPTSAKLIALPIFQENNSPSHRHPRMFFAIYFTFPLKVFISRLPASAPNFQTSSSSLFCRSSTTPFTLSLYYLSLPFNVCSSFSSPSSHKIVTRAAFPHQLPWWFRQLIYHNITYYRSSDSNAGHRIFLKASLFPSFFKLTLYVVCAVICFALLYFPISICLSLSLSLSLSHYLQLCTLFPPSHDTLGTLPWSVFYLLKIVPPSFHVLRLTHILLSSENFFPSLALPSIRLRHALEKIPINSYGGEEWRGYKEWNEIWKSNKKK